MLVDRRLSFILITLLVVSFSTSVAGAQGAGYDPSPVWPLCGYDTNPTGTPTCPSSEWANPDIVNDTYGPRCMDSSDPGCAGGEHDWHYGIDLHAEDDQMPVFASSCGKIDKLDENGGISNNKKVIIEHYRSWATTCPDPTDPGFSFPSCDGGECYYTVYNHLSEIDAGLLEDEFIDKADYLGKSGQNCNSNYPCYSSNNKKRYEHVHFEVQDPTGAGLYETDDSYADAARQRNAVHPLRFLKLAEWDDDAANLEVEILDPGFSNPLYPEPTIQVNIDVENIPRTDRELDLNRVEVKLFDASALHTTGLVEIAQVEAELDALPTPEDHAGGGGSVMYEVNPPFLDMELSTRQYAYSKSKPDYYKYLSVDHLPVSGSAPAARPYQSPFSIMTLGSGASNPFYDFNLPTSYDWGYHHHLLKPGADEWGQFNGAEILSEPYNRTYDDYRLQVKFTELDGMMAADDLCLKARAEDAYGNATDWVASGHCDTPPVPVADLDLSTRCEPYPNAYTVSWTESPWADQYHVYLMPYQDEPHTVWTPRPVTVTDTSYDFGISMSVWVWVEACNAFGCSEPVYAGYAITYSWVCM